MENNRVKIEERMNENNCIDFGYYLEFIKAEYKFSEEEVEEIVNKLLKFEEIRLIEVEADRRGVNIYIENIYIRLGANVIRRAIENNTIEEELNLSEDNLKPIISIKGSNNNFNYKYVRNAYAFDYPIEIETDLTDSEFERYLDGEGYSEEEIERFEKSGKF